MRRKTTPHYVNTAWGPVQVRTAKDKPAAGGDCAENMSRPTRRRARLRRRRKNARGLTGNAGKKVWPRSRRADARRLLDGCL